MYATSQGSLVLRGQLEGFLCLCSKILHHLCKQDVVDPEQVKESDLIQDRGEYMYVVMTNHLLPTLPLITTPVCTSQKDKHSPWSLSILHCRTFRFGYPGEHGFRPILLHVQIELVSRYWSLQRMSISVRVNRISWTDFRQASEDMPNACVSHCNFIGLNPWLQAWSSNLIASTQLPP